MSVLPGGDAGDRSRNSATTHVAANAISSDGTRVIWTSNEEDTGAGHLYMRDTATGKRSSSTLPRASTEPG